MTKRLADNELEIKVRAFDEVKFIRGLHKVANRVTVGLVVAALIDEGVRALAARSAESALHRGKPGGGERICPPEQRRTQGDSPMQYKC